jgi:hypothetical protein
MEGLVIHKENNVENTQKYKPIAFSFRRKYQLSAEVRWKIFEKVAQSKDKFNALC